MTISKGDKLPKVTFMEMTSQGPSPTDTDQVFGGKAVALFAVPGAYTPTCSAKHLPGFLDQYEALVKKGVDEIICTSVNDIFVMDSWGRDSQADQKIRFLADGNGQFAQALGLDMDASGFGMGTRSKRYSMLVRDGVVIELNVEEGGAFEVSSADYLLAQL